MTSSSTAAPAEALSEILPMVARAARLDPGCPVRVRTDDGMVTVLVRLPFAVLAGRTVVARAEPDDATYAAGDLVDWLEGRGGRPRRRDSDWRWAAPPRDGWRRIETVPADVVHRLVSVGARTLADVQAGAGAGAVLRPQAAETLLDTVVIRAFDLRGRSDPSVDITLRQVSAAVRLGFVPQTTAVGIDTAGRWTRLAGTYGSVYAERPGAGLLLAARPR